MCDDKNQNYVYKIVLCMCVEVVRCSLLHRCAVLCILYCSVLCAAYCCILYSVSVYVCILYLFCVCACVCAYCVHIVCILCVYLVCVRYPVEVSTQSDTPHVGYLCGYMVRIIKYKKTQPLIKLKSI